MSVFAPAKLSDLGLTPSMCFDERPPFVPPVRTTPSPSSRTLAPLPSPYAAAVAEVASLERLPDPLDRLRMIRGLAKLICACVDLGQTMEEKERIRAAEEKSSSAEGKELVTASKNGGKKRSIVVGADDLLLLFVLLLVRQSVPRAFTARDTPGAGSESNAVEDEDHAVTWVVGTHGNIHVASTTPISATASVSGTSSSINGGGGGSSLVQSFGDATPVWSILQCVEDYMPHRDRFLMSGYYLATLQAAVELLLTHDPRPDNEH